MYDYKVYNYPAAMYGINGDSEGSNLIVSDSFYMELSRAFSIMYDYMAEAIEMYQKELHEVLNQSVLAGEFRNSLAEFAILFEGLSGQIAKIGGAFRSLCELFLLEIEEADEDLYEAGCDPRDYRWRTIRYYIEMVRDAKGAFGSWLDNYINNFFERLFHKFFSWGKRVNPDAKYTKEYRQSLLNQLDYAEEDIRIIRQAANNVDKEYERKFGELYDALVQVKNIIDKANSIVSGDFSHERIVSLLGEVEVITIKDYQVVPTGNLSEEQIIEFCSIDSNRDVFSEYSSQIDIARDDIGFGEAVSSAISSGLIITKMELIRDEIPREIAAGDRYSYLLLKQHLASTIADMAGTPKNLSEYEKQQILNWVYKAINGDESEIPEEYTKVCETLLRVIKSNSKIAKYLLDGFEEAILPLLYDYSLNLSIIESVAVNVDPDSFLGIAARDLISDYTNKYVTGMTNILNYIEDRIEDVIVESGKDILHEAIKKYAPGLDVYVYMANKATQLAGVNEIGNAAIQLYSLHSSNEQLLQAYRVSFDKVASGKYDEADIESLKYSFDLLRNSYKTELDLAAKIAAVEGSHETKRHYKELSKSISKMSMIDSIG